MESQSQYCNSPDPTTIRLAGKLFHGSNNLQLPILTPQDSIRHRLDNSIDCTCAILPITNHGSPNWVGSKGDTSVLLQLEYLNHKKKKKKTNKSANVVNPDPVPVSWAGFRELKVTKDLPKRPVPGCRWAVAKSLC